ncbi:MAG: ATP-binding cassette domain-containing protein [Eudoraea sp.]|nr:ATP-binding cassette domain-containing protein [Eudoraea sp.]
MIGLEIEKELQAAEGLMNLAINTVVEEGQLITLYGESGAGKTSTLRMLAGLMTPDKGKIVVGGTTWFDAQKKINLSPQKREIGYVFQDYALFPNMTVRENLEFALKKGAADKRITELIDIMELGALQDRKPNGLSGGQQQRVALARALVQRPKILLLDEPLAALDNKIRLKLQEYILTVHREFKLTTILISHDIGEIIRLSSRLLILENGKIVQQGHPEEVFMNRKISGKFKFTGEVLKIEQEEVVYIVTVLIQADVVKVIVQEPEIRDLKVGDKVVVAAKAFNPILYKV